MNALELADEMDKFFKEIGYEENPVSPMLRKQQAYIESLEYQLEKYKRTVNGETGELKSAEVLK